MYRARPLLAGNTPTDLARIRVVCGSFLDAAWLRLYMSVRTSHSVYVVRVVGVVFASYVYGCGARTQRRSVSSFSSRLVSSQVHTPTHSLARSLTHSRISIRTYIHSVPAVQRSRSLAHSSHPSPHNHNCLPSPFSLSPSPSHIHICPGPVSVSHISDIRPRLSSSSSAY